MRSIDYILWSSIYIICSWFQTVCIVSPEALEIVLILSGAILDNRLPSPCPTTWA